MMTIWHTGGPRSIALMMFPVLSAYAALVINFAAAVMCSLIALGCIAALCIMRQYGLHFADTVPLDSRNAYTLSMASCILALQLGAV